jgi:hypothetical protein
VFVAPGWALRTSISTTINSPPKEAIRMVMRLTV